LRRFSASTARFISETFPTSSDGTYDVGNTKFDIDIREKDEVNMKTEKVIGSGEEKCIDIKDQEGLNNEEEEEDIEIKEEVRMRRQCNIL
jgi:hypothetical protein